MQIQFNTDHNIQGHEALTAYVRGKVEAALSRFSEHITRVEVHVRDDDGDKQGPDDKRCVMEVRLEGRQPAVVTHQAASRELAIDGATDKLVRLVEHTLARAVHIDRVRH